MGEYKGYNEVSKKATIKYIKDKQKRIAVNWLKTDFEERIKPAIDKSGLSVSTYFKQAVEEKIQRDKKEGRN